MILSHPSVRELYHGDVLSASPRHVHGVRETDILKQEEQRLQSVVLSRSCSLARPVGQG